MHIFYTPDINSDSYILNEEESRHCVKVLRLTTDAILQLVDGRGGFYEAIITEANPKGTSLKVLSHKVGFGKRNHKLHIAIAPTKNIDRLEWFLEKSTEIGIDEVSPIICERSERRELKTDRLRKVITSAVKQSIKAYHPVLHEPVAFSSFLQNASSSQKFIAHCMNDKKSEIRDCLKVNSDYIVVIGPEGDFSPSELRQAHDAGFIPISLGDSRLRTETAGLAACFEINFLNR